MSKFFGTTPTTNNNPQKPTKTHNNPQQPEKEKFQKNKTYYRFNPVCIPTTPLLTTPYHFLPLRIMSEKSVVVKMTEADYGFLVRCLENRDTIEAFLSKTTTSLSDTTETISEAVQCTGITQAGTRCKNNTTNANHRCHRHQGQTQTTSSCSTSSCATPCAGITRAGAKCKHHAFPGSMYCKKHMPV